MKSDDDHAGDDQIVAVAGVARINDQITQTGAQRDHFRCDHDQPRHAEADAHADDDLRQHGRYHDLAKQGLARHSEIGRGAQVALLDRVHAGNRLHDHRKHRRDEDQEDRRHVADAEPQDRDRNPGNRRNRPQHLEQRIEREVSAFDPAHPQSQWYGYDHRESKSGADAKQ